MVASLPAPHGITWVLVDEQTNFHSNCGDRRSRHLRRGNLAFRGHHSVWLASFLLRRRVGGVGYPVALGSRYLEIPHYTKVAWRSPRHRRDVAGSAGVFLDRPPYKRASLTEACLPS